MSSRRALRGTRAWGRGTMGRRLEEILAEVLRPLGGVAAAVGGTLVAAVRRERELLVEGRWGSEVSGGNLGETGQAYLQGVETWDDVANLVESLPLVRSILTQPQRLSLRKVIRQRFTQYYAEHVRPLIEAVGRHFGDLAVSLKAAVEETSPEASDLVRDLADAAVVTALRARQVLGLYDHASRYRAEDSGWRAQRLPDARRALDEAAAVVVQHEKRYRADPERIAGWGVNPTVYPFGYLWTVRSLFYWWRDEGKAVHRPISPCYLNILNPAVIASSEGEDSRTFRRLDSLLSILGPAGAWMEECLHPPLTPPHLRNRVRPMISAPIGDSLH